METSQQVTTYNPGVLNSDFRIGKEISDNFSPTLRSTILLKGSHTVLLESTCKTKLRKVSYNELEMMIYGV